MVTYTTTSMETPVLVLGVEAEGADYEFDINVTGDNDGQKATLKIDLASKKLAVKIMDNDGSTYGITVRRIDDNGVEEFTHMGNTIGGDDTIYLDYGMWTGQGAPMPSEVDQGSNGSVEMTEMLTDEN
jgi:hypothetical protein